mmetsp:Transcript_8730/g.8644  ORF Transcript_8730/g.8644 Transcript_8730/m.8644 type:complete len:127 (+) Transcript_8730:127-507(+)
MDQKQSELVEKYQESKLRKQINDDEAHDSESEDDLLELLEDDTVLSKYREARIQELSKEFKRIDNEEIERNGSLGSVIEINDEKLIMEIVTNSELTLVHFYQPEFDKCKIMNSRLAVRKPILEPFR